MKSWIIGWHPESQPHQRYEFRCLSGDTESEALNFLCENFRGRYPEEKNIVVRWCVEKPKPVTREHTCGHCGHTRVDEVSQGPLEPPGFFTKDAHLWRTMALRP